MNLISYFIQLTQYVRGLLLIVIRKESKYYFKRI